eukprot:gene11917-14573_t
MNGFPFHLIPDSVTSISFAENLFKLPIKIGDIPPNIKEIYFWRESSLRESKFCVPLQIGSFPDTITTLKFGTSIQIKLVPGMIPNSVVDLHIGPGINTYSPGVIPNSVTKLYLYGDFRKFPLIPGSIPNSVITIIFEHTFAPNLTPGIIPSSVKYIDHCMECVVPGEKFPKSIEPQPLEIGVYPSSVIELKLPYCSNFQLQKGSIPSSVKKLSFGPYYNNPIEFGVLPESLETLKIEGSFKQTIKPGTLPNSLKTIEFSTFHSEMLHEGSIPKSVDTLKASFSIESLPLSIRKFNLDCWHLTKDLVLVLGLYIYPNKRVSVEELSPEEKQKYESMNGFPFHLIPDSVTSINFAENLFKLPIRIGDIPPNIKEINFCRESSLRKSKFCVPLQIGSFPDTITKLKFTSSIQIKLVPGMIPNSVVDLHIGPGINTYSPGVFPNSFTKLQLYGDFRKFPLIPGSIPNSVITIIFEHTFAPNLTPGIIPSSVKYIDYSIKYELPGELPKSIEPQPLEIGVYPSSVIELKLPFCSNFQLQKGSIPSSVKKLTIESGFKQTIKPGTLPNSLKTIEFATFHSEMLHEGSIPKSVDTLKAALSIRKFNLDCYHLTNDLILVLGLYYNHYKKVSLEELSPEEKQKYESMNGFPFHLIPDSVTSISFSENLYKLPIKIGDIPPNIKEIYFWQESPLRESKFCVPLQIGSFPDTITKLEFTSSIQIKLVPGMIPNSVVDLLIGPGINIYSPGVIPNSVTKLHLYGDFRKSPLIPGSIPNSVITLIFEYSFAPNLTPGIIPSSVKYIDYNIKCFSPDEKLPKSIEPQPLEIGVYPSSVIELKLPFYSNFQLQKGSIPSSVKKLFFGPFYNNPIEFGILPDSLETLMIGNKFKQTIKPGTLPNSLKKIEFSIFHSEMLPEGSIPKSVDTLKFSHYLYGLLNFDRKCNIKELDLEFFKGSVLIESLPLSIRKFNVDCWYLTQDLIFVFGPSYDNKKKVSVEELSPEEKQKFESWIEYLLKLEYFQINDTSFRRIDSKIYTISNQKLLKFINLDSFFNDSLYRLLKIVVIPILE